jgi:cysteinyl-tRNA synthetase
MATKYLGETLDIHCGGVDLIFPHHEDEIAQSEAATGKPFSRFWCHGEFLLVDGTKMAKRIGNVSTVKDLRDQGVSAAAIRHFVFCTHYRKQVNLSAPALEASVEAVTRIGEFAHRLANATGGTSEMVSIADQAEAQFRSALDDDLSAPEAVAALFTFVQRSNAELDRNGTDIGGLDRARQVFALLDSVLDVQPRSIRFTIRGPEVSPDPSTAEDLSDTERASVLWAIGRLAERVSARQKRDFAASDAVRAEVEERGFLVKDTPSGVVLEKYH